MKIYYEPYKGYNSITGSASFFAFIEPEKHRLLREIGVDYILYEITRNAHHYYMRPSLMTQLLVEQRQVLMSHVYIYFNMYGNNFRKPFRDELQRLADCEVEPGMFRNEDIL
ncbi:MAG: hypothetical protein ACXACY_19075 [Candidatus Hodarchaeales archaeon]|jgi:hypothetical protein